MRLGEALARVREIHPHFFNSFYRRVRVVRETPRPMPTAATVDVTHRCSLACPFCIAADTLDQREMGVETFARVAAELAGIGRLTLIGGEPFQHPDLPALVAAARKAADEVELFTNGLVLGADPAQAPERLARQLPEAAGDWLTLVLSVDPAHARQMRGDRLARIVEGALAAEAAGLCRSRFSVTHESLVTGAYLDADTVARAIREVSPALAESFQSQLLAGRVQDTFYFNSVICAQPPPAGSGTAARGLAEAGPEVLRLEDLIFAPEIAISFDAAGEPVVFTSLASMWSKSPPPATLLGPLPQATEILMHGVEEECTTETQRTQRTGVRGLRTGDRERPGPPSPFCRRSPRSLCLCGEVFDGALARCREVGDWDGEARLVRGWEAFAAVMEWDGGEAFARAQADRVLAFVGAGTGDRVLRWGGEEGGGAVETLVLAQVVRGLLADEARSEAMRRSLGAQLREWFTAPDGRLRAPVFRGARELLGARVPLAPGETRPIHRAHLPGEAGFTPRDEEVVRPVLELHSDGNIALRLPGIEAGPGTDAPAALQRVLGMVACVCGGKIARAAAKALRAEVARAAGEALHAEVGGWRIGGWEEEERKLVLPAADDLATAFSLASWDRNRQRPDEDNPELLALLLRCAGERFSRKAVNAFAARALTWLERWQRREGALPPVARELLETVKLPPREARRLGRLT